jgi:hypothetical protein
MGIEFLLAQKVEDMNHLILHLLHIRLDTLTWQCSGCPQLKACDEQPNGGEIRYCWPIIEAAILGKSEWKTNHREVNFTPETGESFETRCL